MMRFAAIVVCALTFCGVQMAATSSLTETTIYIGRHFEVREHDQPVKYVFNGETRVSRVVGSLNSDLRIQRLRLHSGWNLCSLAVTPTNLLAQLNNSLIATFSSEQVFLWNRPTREWVGVAPGESVVAGSVLWILSNTNGHLPLIGNYLDPTNRTVEVFGDFVPAAGLECWNSVLIRSNFATAALANFDALGREWFTRLPGPLPTTQDFPAFISPGSALFINVASPVDLEVPPEALRIRYYHQDHLGSSAIVADAEGKLVEEKAFYPYGEPRYQQALPEMNEPYQFTQKERDVESRLNAVGLRYLSGACARFTSVDPKYVHPDRLEPDIQRGFLQNPQALNLYAYALGNPLKFIDPTGLEVVWSEGLTKDKAFQKALKILEDTVEGKRILQALENANVSGDVGKLAGGHGVEETGHAKLSASIEGRRNRKEWVATTKITIDLAKAKKMGLTPYELANVIHHELRHAEIHHTPRLDDNWNTEEGIAQGGRRRNREHKDLDVYIPLNTGNGADRECKRSTNETPIFKKKSNCSRKSTCKIRIKRGHTCPLP